MAETGVAVAIVVDNTDSSGTGRVRVRYPWLTDSADTYWARVATPMAGGKRGIYFIPEKGDEVLVAFERGDVRLPYVIGSLWNADAPPPATNTDGRNDVRLIRTRKGHLLKFDDGARGSVRLELNDGKHVVIDDNGIALEDRNGNGILIDTAAGALTIRSSGQLTLKASQISIEASGTIAVKASATLTLQGSLVTVN